MGGAGSPEDAAETEVANGCSVRVAVRVRPLIGQELTERCSECIRISRDNSRQIVVGSNTCFTFDHVFSKDNGQHEIYNDCVAPLVSAAFEGFNATVLAYGQTGSGKTYTMGSASNTRLSQSEQGIIPRVIEEIFTTMARKREQEPNNVYRVSAQFLEIYGEEIKDLLDLVNSRVTIRENQDGEITVSGAREETVESSEELRLVLERGTLCRTTGSTLMNAQSSRSHAIFTIFLENRSLRSDSGQPGGEEQFEVRRSKFHFVDLAGSERAKRTGAEGKRLKEGIDINRGLLVLGNVISALGDSKKRGRVHVPYRDSKLTRMLQDSLGGNSQTLMIACVSPAETNLHETLNALRYANRARNIQNKPIVNRDRDSALIVELKRQVTALASELLRIKAGGVPTEEGGEGGVGMKELLENLVTQHATPGNVVPLTATMQQGGPGYDVVRSRLEDAEVEVQRLTHENKRLKAREGHMSEALLQCTAEKEFYRLRLGDGAEGPEAGEGKQSVMEAIKGYLAEIAALKDGMVELERSKRTLEVKLEQMGTPPYMRMPMSRRDSRDSEAGVGMDEEGERPQEAMEVDEGRAQDEARPLMMAESKDGRPSLGMKRRRKMSGDDEVKLGLTMAGTMSRSTMQLDPEQEEEQKVWMEQEAGASSRKVQEYSISVAEIDINIEMKEKLMKQLHESQKRYEIMKRFYEEKLKLMDEETSRFEGERQKLVRELEEVERRSEDEQKGVHQALSKKLKDKEEQLREARQKQEELSQLARVKTRTEVQIKQLTDEIGNMRKQRADLLKRIDAEKRRFQNLLKEKTVEIETMRRAAKRDAQEIQRLGHVIEKAHSARRRQEEDQRRTRDLLQRQRSLGNSGTGLLMTTSSPRPGLSASQLHGYTEVEKKTKKWLDVKIREVAKKEKAAEELAAEYQRRMALLKTKEYLEKARNRIFGSGKQSVRDMILTNSPYSPRGATDGEGSSRNLGEGVNVLSADEEATLEELEERIEACRTQLEYKDDRIRKIETIIKALPDLNGGVSTSAIAESCGTLEQSHTVIRVLFDMLVASRRMAKTGSEKVKDLDQEVLRLSRSLEESETRFKAERRVFDQELIRQTITYEEKISGLIDHSTFSGLIGTVSTLTMSQLPNEPTSEVQATGEGWAHAEQPELTVSGPTADQYRCIMKLSNERNQALREQFHQAQAGREDLQMQMEELEGRLRRAQEDTREKDDTIKWLEFELTKVRAEYIKLRELKGRLGGGGGNGGNGAPSVATAAGGKAAWAAPRKAMTSEELRKLEAEVLGEESEEEEEEEEDLEASDGAEGEEEEEAKGVGGDREGDEVEPSWAKGVTDDIDKHIKAGRVPPILIAKTREFAERDRMVFQSPNNADGRSQQQALFLRRAPSDRTAAEMASSYSSIFDRLADPQHFTGIHKHVNAEEVAEKRQRVELIKSKIEQTRSRVRTKRITSRGTPLSVQRGVQDGFDVVGQGMEGEGGMMVSPSPMISQLDAEAGSTPRSPEPLETDDGQPTIVFHEANKSLQRPGRPTEDSRTKLLDEGNAPPSATGDLVMTDLGDEATKDEPRVQSGELN